jgi:hypothetical protein
LIEAPQDTKIDDELPRPWARSLEKLKEAARERLVAESRAQPATVKACCWTA